MKRADEILDQRLVKVQVRWMHFCTLAFARPYAQAAFVEHRNMHRALTSENIERILRLERGVSDHQRTARILSRRNIESASGGARTEDRVFKEIGTLNPLCSSTMMVRPRIVPPSVVV